jgi:hypothetical protein
MALVLAACGVSDEPSATTTSSIATTSTAAVSPTTSDDSTSTSETDMPDQTALVEDAIAALADKLQTTERPIEVVEVRAVEWPDGSLGCPEEGKVYTQAIVPGFQILLRYGDTVYVYHAADGQVLLCPSEEKDGGYDFVPPPGFDES